MRLASIDIGSNAIRMQISDIRLEGGVPYFKKLEFIRFPLRLGHDVFSYGKISHKTEMKFVHLMDAFQNFFRLYEIDDYRACATSAMREAENGVVIAERVSYKLGITIDIIDGNEEAELIARSIKPFITREKNIVHIDVGGGSTEINIYSHGELIDSHSFKVGSVRKLTPERYEKMFTGIREWMDQFINHTEEYSCLGTGGNINKLFKLSEEKLDKKTVSYEELVKTRAYIDGFSIEERINKLKLNADRADVIIPASGIYLEVMRMCNADKMIVPGLGLKDGIIQALYSKITDRKESLKV